MTVRSVVLMMLAALTFNLLPHPARAEFQKLRASDGAAGDYFGWSVSIDGDTAIIGALRDDDKGIDSGAAYVFVRSGTTWIQQAKLTAEDGAALDQFGISVSVSGNTAVIGANCKAYVFIRSGITWTQQAKLTSIGGDAFDQFGISVSLSGDTAVIGGNSYAIAFIRSGNIWTQQAKFTPSDSTSGDTFGLSVSVSGDTAVIASSSNEGKTGCAYVYTRLGTVWTQEAKLTVPDSTAIAAFHWWPVLISGDTAMLAQAFGVGCAYVFTRSENGDWTQEAKLTPEDNKDNSGFGWSLSIVGDTAVITAPADYPNGSAYVFVRSENTWMQRNKLAASDGASGDSFGFAAAMSGTIAVIGANKKNGDTGSAYIISTDYSPAKATSLPATLHLLLGR